MKKFIIKQIASSLIIFIFGTNMPIFAMSENVTVTAMNTVAGYASLVKVAGPANQEIEIKLKKPDSGNLFIPVTTDQTGQAQFDLYAYHTKQAGIYEIAGRLKSDERENFGESTSFQVYSDEVSPERSEITASKLLAAANNYDTITLTVRLLDKYGNPIPYHAVSLISSRAEDIIAVDGAKQTSQTGEISYHVSSGQAGVSIYSIFDTTGNQAINKRVKVIYYHQTNFSAIGGEANILLSSVYAQSTTGPVTSLKISDLPATVKINDSLNFKVGAYDQNNQLVSNYNGTVHFSTTDTNANIPTDYTFTAQDLGQHTFSLSLNFATTGTHTLSVSDTKNSQIKGEISVEVTPQTNQQNNNNSTNQSISITKPQSSRISATSVPIQGVGPASSRIKIYDQDEELGEVVADGSGNFTYTAKDLSTGQHIFYVAAVDSAGGITGTSAEVVVQIDTSAPTIDDIQLTPAGSVEPGESIKIEVYSQKDVNQIAVIFNEEITELTADLSSDGLYAGNLIAPERSGEYPVDIILVDQLGNDVSYKNKAQVTVSAAGDSIGGDNPPSKVTGLQAEPGINRVTLSWEESADNTGLDHYRVYYGTEPDVLTETVDTKTASTTWYVPNLTPGLTYYFIVKAVDSEGNASLEPSLAISAAPLDSNETEETVSHAGGPDDANPLPDKNPSSGPATTGFIVFTIIFTGCYCTVRWFYPSEPVYKLNLPKK